MLSVEFDAKAAPRYTDFQFEPLHINICSSSKDNSTQGTNSCDTEKKVMN